MGLTTELVQVRRVPSSTDADLQNALAAIIHSEGGWSPTNDPREADRSIYISGQGSPWAAIFDSAGGCDELGRRLSEQLNTLAVAITVFDSDELFLHLFHSGRASGAIESSLGRGRVLGKFDPWEAALATGTLADLRRALTADTTFVEQRLESAARLFGMNPELCVITPEDFLHTDEESLAMHFRAAGKRDVPAGPPQLVAEGAQPVTASVGDTLDSMLVAFSNRGGEGRGLTVHLHGNAVTSGLIELKDVTLIQFAPGAGQELRTVQTTLPVTESLGGSMIASHADVQLQSFPRTTLDLSKPSVQAVKRMAKEASRARFSVKVQARAAQQGAGTLRVTVIPKAAPKEQASFEVPLEIGPALPRPLYAGDQRSLPYLLRHMESRTCLVALAAFRCDTPTAASAVREFLDGWAPHVQPGSSWELMQMASSSGLAFFPPPKAGKAKPGGKAWKERLQSLGQSSHTQGGAGDASFAFQIAPMGFFTFPPEQLAPHFVCSLSRAASPEQETLFRAAFDRWTREGWLYQALLARWGGPITPDHTPYEQACSVPAMAVSTRIWCSRYLRAATPKLWLGPDLANRIPAALGEPLGQGLRIEHQGPLRDLELLLEPVLPTPTRWRQTLQTPAP